MLKNKQLLYGIGVVVILVVLAGGYFLFLGNKSESGNAKPTASQEEVVNTLKPEDVGLTLKLRDDKNAATFVMDKVDGVVTVDYEMDYKTTNDVQRGITAQNLKPINGKVRPKEDWIIFGTSSSGVNKYDKDVHDVQFVFRVNKTDNKVYEVQKTLSM